MKRILSVQSHVVHGYVGNKAATLPLQILGFQVDPLNTVQFSNHTGYRVFKGERTSDTTIDLLLQGLDANNIKYTHILTGYVGTVEALRTISKWISKLKQQDMIVMIDPVMGDNNRMYVPESFLDCYRDDLISMADIITPNGYEASLLTGMEMKEDEMLKVLQKLHSLGPKMVVITSVEFEKLYLYGSDGSSVFRIEIPKIAPKVVANFTGTGDLFAALLIGNLEKGLLRACEISTGCINQILKKTVELNDPELAIVSSIDIVRNSDCDIKATIF